MFELDNVKNEAILRDLFIFQGWLHKKTQQFSETSSIFAFDNIEIKAILRDFLKKWKVQCSADSLVPMRFAIFPLHLSKVLRLPRKSDARSYEVLHLSRKIILANLQIWCSKMQPLAGNPDLLTSLMNTSFVLRLPRKCIFADPLQMSHACHHSWKCYQNPHPRFGHFWQGAQSLAPAARNDIWTSKKWSVHGVFCTFWLGNVLRATTACTFSTSQLPKVVRSWCALYILTSKCTSRYNGVHFFYISTSKSGPALVCLLHFDLEICFAPQRRALFLHLNFQKWSEPCVLHILTWKSASRHNGVQFFISHLANWLRTRRFSEPTFGPSGDTNHWKNTVFRDFPTFSRICIFFLLTLSLLLFSLLIFLFSLHLPCSAFHLSILSEVSLTSKLPSIIYLYIYIFHANYIISTSISWCPHHPSFRRTCTAKWTRKRPRCPRWAAAWTASQWFIAESLQTTPFSQQCVNVGWITLCFQNSY